MWKFCENAADLFKCKLYEGMSRIPHTMFGEKRKTFIFTPSNGFNIDAAWMSFGGERKKSLIIPLLEFCYGLTRCSLVWPSIFPFECWKWGSWRIVFMARQRGPQRFGLTVRKEEFGIYLKSPKWIFTKLILFLSSRFECVLKLQEESLFILR